MGKKSLWSKSWRLDWRRLSMRLCRRLCRNLTSGSADGPSVTELATLKAFWKTLSLGGEKVSSGYGYEVLETGDYSDRAKGVCV
jgi:hypothetical protein